MLKKLFFCAFAALLTAPAAVSQAVDFVWSFTPATYTSGSIGTISFLATTDLTSIHWAAFDNAALPPVGINRLFGLTEGGDPYNAEFLGFDLTPGQTYTFTFPKIFPGAWPGLYAGLSNEGLALYTLPIVSTNAPNVLRATPEGGAALMYLLLAGAACFGTMVFSPRSRFGGRETS